MKKYILFFAGLCLTITSFCQDDVKTMHETAKTFMRSGDFDNAILVLNRAIQKDNNIELQKDLALSYYMKRDFAKAKEQAKELLDRDDADEASFQIAGNVYKALEEIKDCEKLYKKGLKKFPKSGPLYNEYGELLWGSKNIGAIEFWEKGIQNDPSYAGNYYNAAYYYFSINDKIWSLIYGEIFVNMESLSDRAAAMKQMLLKAYKEKLFADPEQLKEENITGKGGTKNEFARAFLLGLAKQSSLVSRGISVETLTMIRSRFILDWFQSSAGRFPFRLFDYQRQLLQNGMFEAYNQWLFGPVENLATYDNWTKTHPDQFETFSKFQRSRIFKVPAGQYYQTN
jgi:tetratricopeptide (TPR) repeat protein